MKFIEQNTEIKYEYDRWYEDPGKIHFIVPKFWEKNRMRSETQPY